MVFIKGDSVSKPLKYIIHIDSNNIPISIILYR